MPQFPPLTRDIKPSRVCASPAQTPVDPGLSTCVVAGGRWAPAALGQRLSANTPPHTTAARAPPMPALRRPQHRFLHHVCIHARRGGVRPRTAYAPRSNSCMFGRRPTTARVRRRGLRVRTPAAPNGNLCGALLGPIPVGPPKPGCGIGKGKARGWVTSTRTLLRLQCGRAPVQHPCCDGG
jgi:hypothetical protein